MGIKERLADFSSRYQDLKTRGEKLKAEQAQVFGTMFKDRATELAKEQAAFDKEFMDFIEKDLKVEGDVHASDLLAKCSKAMNEESRLIFP